MTLTLLGVSLFNDVPLGATVYLVSDQIPGELRNDPKYPPTMSSSDLPVWAGTKVSPYKVCLWATPVTEEEDDTGSKAFFVGPGWPVFEEEFSRRHELNVHGVVHRPGRIVATPSYLSDILSTTAAIMEGLVTAKDWEGVLHSINDDLGNRNGHMTLYELVSDASKALQKAYTQYLNAHPDPDHPSPYLYDVPGEFSLRMLKFMRDTSTVPEEDWITQTASTVISEYFNPPPMWSVSFSGGTTPMQVKARSLVEIEERIKSHPTYSPNIGAIRDIRRIAN